MAQVGYKRVSTVDQKTDRQLEGMTFDREFEDKITGSTIKRPGLEDCLRYLRDGDVLYVHSIDRLARNLIDLQQTVKDLNERGVEVRFVQENLVFYDKKRLPATDKDGAMAKLMFQMMGAFAEFERAIIKERQREGIAAAKAKGKHLGRKATLTAAQCDEIRARAAGGERVADLAKEFRVSRETIYKTLRPSEN